MSGHGSNQYTDTVVAAASGFPIAQVASLIANPNGGAVGVMSGATKFLSNLTDNTATNAMLVTIPNASGGFSINIFVTGTRSDGGSTDGKHYTIGVSRIAGANAIVAVSAAAAGGQTTAADTFTVTSTVTASGLTGASSATQTFFINVTVARSGGASTGHSASIFAELLSNTVAFATLSAL